MKSVIFVATLAFVAIQLTCAAPAPENVKKDATGDTIPSEVVNPSPRVAEVKAEDGGVTRGLEDASTWSLRDASKGPAIGPEKAQ